MPRFLYSALLPYLRRDAIQFDAVRCKSAVQQPKSDIIINLSPPPHRPDPPFQFTRKPPKYERFIRPTGLRFKKAHVTHPELQATFCLDILGVKKNPQSQMFTQLGVITKGTVIEVNVSDLGLVTTSGKVVWGKYAQVTNNPELDGCINGVLLV